MKLCKLYITEMFQNNFPPALEEEKESGIDGNKKNILRSCDHKLADKKS